MDNVQFEDQTTETVERKITSHNRSKMAEWLMRFGIIQNEKGANFILIGVAVFFFLMSVLILLLGASKNPTDSYNNAIRTVQSSSEQSQ